MELPGRWRVSAVRRALPRCCAGGRPGDRGRGRRLGARSTRGRATSAKAGWVVQRRERRDPGSVRSADRAQQRSRPSTDRRASTCRRRARTSSWSPSSSSRRRDAYKFDPETGAARSDRARHRARPDRRRLDLQERGVSRVVGRALLQARRLLLGRHQRPGEPRAARVRARAAGHLPRRGHAHDHAQHARLPGRRARGQQRAVRRRTASAASTSTTSATRPNPKILVQGFGDQSPDHAPDEAMAPDDAGPGRGARTARTRSSSGRTAPRRSR